MTTGKTVGLPYILPITRSSCKFMTRTTLTQGTRTCALPSCRASLKVNAADLYRKIKKKTRKSREQTYRFNMVEDEKGMRTTTRSVSKMRQTIDSLRNLVGDSERTRREREALSSAPRAPSPIKSSGRKKNQSVPWGDTPVSFGLWISMMDEEEFNQFLVYFAITMLSLPLSIIVLGYIRSYMINN